MNFPTIWILLPALIIPPAQQSPQPWEHTCRWMRGQAERLAADLATAHSILLERACEELPKAVERLEPTPPAPLPVGYGVLPAIKDDAALSRLTPREWVYSLEQLSLGFTADFRAGALLAGRVSAGETAPLAPLVDEFVRLRASLRNIEEHISYHEWWQVAIHKDLVYFEGRNKIVAKVRELVALPEDVGSREQAERLRLEIHAAVAPFEAADLAIVKTDSGGWQLDLALHTDIEDEGFLSDFVKSIESNWNQAEAMIARDLHIDLVFVHHGAAELYPGGPPAPEAAIEVEEHVARFPSGAMVLTTGAASTHAWRCRSILLGPVALTRRTLAHEFGHLLGFSDAYLRGFDGTTDADFGLVIIEWQGLLGDLMGNPGGGTVSRAMVEQLFEAYASE
ncbi:MAG: hypothetical protein ABGY71_02980 [bacterium]|nr:hypothetical protein [Planctomycetota bacterium]HIL52741.1 hypothetical protein [Planctomycetota bacterium]